MKSILLNNWQAKLVSLILAFALWYLIKQNVGRTPQRFEFMKDTPTKLKR
jgi:YbbR domain-containing protein